MVIIFRESFFGLYSTISPPTSSPLLVERIVNKSLVDIPPDLLALSENKE